MVRCVAFFRKHWCRQSVGYQTRIFVELQWTWNVKIQLSTFKGCLHVSKAWCFCRKHHVIAVCGDIEVCLHTEVIYLGWMMMQVILRFPWKWRHVVWMLFNEALQCNTWHLVRSNTNNETTVPAQLMPTNAIKNLHYNKGSQHDSSTKRTAPNTLVSASKCHMLLVTLHCRACWKMPMLKRRKAVRQMTVVTAKGAKMMLRKEGNMWVKAGKEDIIRGWPPRM